MTERGLDDERPQTGEERSEVLSDEKHRVRRESGTEPRFSSSGAGLDFESDAEREMDAERERKREHCRVITNEYDP